MDALKAQHLFDVIEQNLSEIKADVLDNSENGSSYSDLEDEVNTLESEVEDLNHQVADLEGDLDDFKTARTGVIKKLEEFLADINRDFPTYSTDDLSDAIQILEDL